MLSHETNARRLVAVLLQHFPVGGTSEDLRKQFEIDTGLVNQSFYNALKHAKQQKWLIGGGRGQPYCLSPEGSWKEPDIASIGGSIGVSRDRDQLEYLVDTQTQQIQGLQSEIEQLRDWSDGSDADGAGVAIPSLIRIITNDASTMRQRLKAAETILSYKVEDASVVEFTKKFLQSVCTSADVATDHRVEAAGLLRRCESPRVAPETVRPSYRESEPEEPPEPLAELVARRKARQDAYERELALHPDMDALPSDVCAALNAKYSRHRDDH